MRITVWNEYLHERQDDRIGAIYPQGIHGALAALLGAAFPTAEIRTATLDEAEHGLSETVLEQTDVLLWWGHLAHEAVADAVVDRVQTRVLEGMGLIVLHSAHLSKIFRRLMGTTCNLRWREADERELVWTVHPAHPIAAGVPQPVVLSAHEMYGELFDIPAPDELVFISAFAGGEVFRSGCCFYRGKGRVFYFSPGHEAYPIYHQPDIARIISNAVGWVFQPQASPIETQTSPNTPMGWFEQPS